MEVTCEYLAQNRCDGGHCPIQSLRASHGEDHGLPSLTTRTASPSACSSHSLVSPSLLWQRVVTVAALESRRQLYMSSQRADCNRASLTRVHRQTYARLYPVLLVKQDGSTIHIRYREPRQILTMPVDLDSLSPEERRARFRKREAQVKEKEEEPELGDDFDVEQYKQFWTKK
ncbi:large ribosomal subunit protein mL55 isoform X2 [Lagenorhynchus albirostris]|uniref:large ribosomal subunit protein mL55 isoform X2 n=1 Tax=Lagenorhynchus albirostris TaxID=27610 RepID=UPI0028E8AB64|nr:large ribosomal subunit protein mL55 isoform X2 [Lagenorhynchus albirostris]